MRKEVGNSVRFARVSLYGVCCSTAMQQNIPFVLLLLWRRDYMFRILFQVQYISINPGERISVLNLVFDSVFRVHVRYSFVLHMCVPTFWVEEEMGSKTHTAVAICQ